METQYTWISEHDTTNVRDINLRRSKALAHAARRSHRARQSPWTIHVGYDTDTITRRNAPRVTRSPQAREDTLPSDDHVASPKLPKPVLEVSRSLGQAPSLNSRKVFDFVKNTWAAETFLTDGHNASPWLAAAVTEMLCRRTLFNCGNEFQQIVEDLPYAAALEIATGTSRKDSHSARCEAVVLKAAREAVNDATTPITPTTWLDTVPFLGIILKLLTHAVNAGRVSQARLHGAVLQRMLIQMMEEHQLTSIDSALMAYILHHDAQIAGVTASSTVFDVEYWLPLSTSPSIRALEADLQPFYDEYIQELPLLQTSARLQRLRITFHEWTWLWCKKSQNGLLESTHDTEVVVTYFALVQCALEARLNNYFVELRQSVKAKPSTTNTHPSSSPSLYAELFTTLSLLLYLSTFAGNPNFKGVYLWHKARRYLTELQSTLLIYLHTAVARRSSSTPRVSSMDERVMLFAFWAGATWEQKGPADSQNISTDWFTARFVGLAEQMGVRDWAGAKAVLDQVCCCDYARPQGSSWVDSVLKSQAYVL
jgi:hypothetical protein